MSTRRNRSQAESGQQRIDAVFPQTKGKQARNSLVPRCSLFEQSFIPALVRSDARAKDVATKAGSKVKAPPAPTAKKSKKKNPAEILYSFHDSYERNGVIYNVGDDGEPMAHARS